MMSYELERIEELCRERGWSHYRLALEMDTSPNNIGNLFRRTTVPSIWKDCQPRQKIYSGKTAVKSSPGPAYRNSLTPAGLLFFVFVMFFCALILFFVFLTCFSYGRSHW